MKTLNQPNSQKLNKDVVDLYREWIGHDITESQVKEIRHNIVGYIELLLKLDKSNGTKEVDEVSISIKNESIIKE